MVLPDYPGRQDDILHMGGGGTLGIESEDSEEDFPLENAGYELLPSDINEIANIELDDSDDEWSNGDPVPPTPDVTIVPQDIRVVPEPSERPDIVINSDEVKAVMSNITLPPSSFPKWAEGIPESEWTEILRSKITTLQNRSS